MLVSLFALTACSITEDNTANPLPQNPPVTAESVDFTIPLVSMAQVASVPVPAVLTSLTGITWHESSGQFIAVSDSGQIATIDGNAFTLSGLIDSGLPTLADITAGDGNTIAMSSSGARVMVAVNETGQPQVVGTQTSTLDFVAQGIAIHPLLGVPVVSSDSSSGPSLWLLGESTTTLALQLNDETLTATSSLVLLGPTPLVSNAKAPVITRFDENGNPNLRLRAEGLSTIDGITNRDGTLIVTGSDSNNEPILAAYNVQNDEEINPDPSAGPATLTRLLQPTATISLPAEVVQPSGIAYDVLSDSLLVNTDQAEFFALSPDLVDIRYSFDVPGFTQGAIEDIHMIGPGRAAVVSESASYVPFEFDGTTWNARELVQVDGVDEEVSAIGHNEMTNQLAFIAESGPGKTLISTTLAGAPVQDIAIDTRAVGIDNLDDYTVAGITYHDGLFYVLSEQYSTVFTMTTAGVVTAAYGLDDAVEPTGLTVFDGSLWVVFDHEDSEPTPPVARYPLPQ